MLPKWGVANLSPPPTTGNAEQPPVLTAALQQEREERVPPALPASAGPAGPTQGRSSLKPARTRAAPWPAQERPQCGRNRGTPLGFRVNTPLPGQEQSRPRGSWSRGGPGRGGHSQLARHPPPCRSAALYRAGLPPPPPFTSRRRCACACRTAWRRPAARAASVQSLRHAPSSWPRPRVLAPPPRPARCGGGVGMSWGGRGLVLMSPPVKAGVKPRTAACLGAEHNPARLFPPLPASEGVFQCETP